MTDEDNIVRIEDFLTVPKRELSMSMGRKLVQRLHQEYDPGDTYNPNGENNPEFIRLLKESCGNIVELMNLLEVNESGDLTPQGKVNLGTLASMVNGAIMTHPTATVASEYQGIVCDAFESMRGIVELLEFGDNYLGKESEGEKLVLQYFDNFPFTPTDYGSLYQPKPIHAVLEDWGAAVKYCIQFGIPKEAVLDDGTPLFKLQNEVYKHACDHPEEFPGLNPIDLDNGRIVNEWLINTPIGRNEDCTTWRAWTMVLTGYPEEINHNLGLDKRYNEPLLFRLIYEGNKH
jgi:hypothetical protein